MKNDPRIASYLNHLAYIDDKKPPPKQVQYLNYTHSIAWSFPKENKRNLIHYYFIIINIIKELL
jgi:hypothetical protein